MCIICTVFLFAVLCHLCHCPNGNFRWPGKSRCLPRKSDRYVLPRVTDNTWNCWNFARSAGLPAATVGPFVLSWQHTHLDYFVTVRGRGGVGVGVGGGRGVTKVSGSSFLRSQLVLFLTGPPAKQNNNKKQNKTKQSGRGFDKNEDGWTRKVELQQQQNR